MKKAQSSSPVCQPVYGMDTSINHHCVCVCVSVGMCMRARRFIKKKGQTQHYIFKKLRLALSKHIEVSYLGPSLGL